MYRADKVREEPGCGQGAAREHWAADRTKLEKGQGNQQRIALAPTALDSNSYFNVVFGAMGRMEPGAAGATQAGRHTQTTAYMW